MVLQSIVIIRNEKVDFVTRQSIPLQPELQPYIIILNTTNKPYFLCGGKAYFNWRDLG